MNRFASLVAGVFIFFFGLTAFAGAQTMNSPHLNAKQQAIVPIAAFTASGDMDKLKTALNDGLDAGLSVNEIKEVLVQMYAYAGFPRSLNGLDAFMNVMETRRQKGVRDDIGREPGPLPPGRSSLEFGAENQTRLTGGPVAGPLFEFAPAIDQFLKGHLFGDIFARDNLDWQSREVATIAALASINGVESQLQSHIRIGMHNGLSALQLEDLIAILESRVGTRQAGTAKEALRAVLGNR